MLSLFEAWLDEENRIVSFHEIPDSRYYSTEYQTASIIVQKKPTSGR